MTLRYWVREALVIPQDAFNKDDIATIVVTGSSYDGMWVMNAISAHTPPDHCHRLYPDR